MSKIQKYSWNIIMITLLMSKGSVQETFAQDCLKSGIYLSSIPDCNTNDYYLVFEDNFDGSSLDNSKWMNSWPNARTIVANPEQQYYSDGNNIEISNGTLKLIAKKETVYERAVPNFPDDQILSDGKANKRIFNYTSGMIFSKFKFFQGKYEVRCKMPDGKGFWPAFWLFGGQRWNEIDIIDNLQGNVHLSYGSSYDFDDDGDAEGCRWGTDNVPDFSEWHTFTCIFDFDKIIWQIDGSVVRIFYRFGTSAGNFISCGDNIEPATYFEEQSFPVEPMHIILNLAIMASGVNKPDASSPFPSSMEIDYIRYYKKGLCDGPLDITDISTLDLNSGVYNIIIGTTINLSENVIIQSGQQLEVVARDKIVLSPGFSTEVGSRFVARIDPSICVGASKMSNIFNDKSINKDSLQHVIQPGNKLQIDSTEKDCQVRIFPNPNEGKFSVEFAPSSADSYELYLINDQGRILYSLKAIDKLNIDIDISKYSTGTYFLNIIDVENKNAYTHKIIKN